MASSNFGVVWIDVRGTVHAGDDTGRAECFTRAEHDDPMAEARKWLKDLGCQKITKV